MPHAAATLSLSAGRPLRLTGARDRHIVVVAGTVWITACGLADDVFLDAGGRFRITTHQLVLVEAIGSAKIRIEARQSRPQPILAVRRWLSLSMRLPGLRRPRCDKMRHALPPPRTDPA